MADKPTEFRQDADGSLDEVVAHDCFVHVERLGERHMWIGIEPKGGTRLMIDTGVEDGKWYFRVREDAEGGREFVAQEEV